MFGNKGIYAQYSLMYGINRAATTQLEGIVASLLRIQLTVLFSDSAGIVKCDLLDFHASNH